MIGREGEMTTMCQGFEGHGRCICECVVGMPKPPDRIVKYDASHPGMLIPRKGMAKER